MMGTSMLTSSAPMPRRRSVLNVTLEEIVVWAYQTQRVEAATAAQLENIELEVDEFMVGSRSSQEDSVARAMRIGDLGTSIDGGGRSIACHPDAERVHDEVCVITRTWKHAGMLIRRFGRSGEAPEWQTEEPKPAPVLVASDSRAAFRHKIEEATYLVEQRKPRIGRGEQAGARVEQLSETSWALLVKFCPIHYYPPPEYAEEIRKEYSTWHRAMTRLMERIDKIGFQEHRVTGFEAPAEPWCRA